VDRKVVGMMTGDIEIFELHWLSTGYIVVVVAVLRRRCEYFFGGLRIDGIFIRRFAGIAVPECFVIGAQVKIRPVICRELKGHGDLVFAPSS